MGSRKLKFCGLVGDARRVSAYAVWRRGSGFGGHNLLLRHRSDFVVVFFSYSGHAEWRLLVVDIPGEQWIFSTCSLKNGDGPVSYSVCGLTFLFIWSSPDSLRIIHCECPATGPSNQDSTQIRLVGLLNHSSAKSTRMTAKRKLRWIGHVPTQQICQSIDG